jgi:rhodanese-related sulfurtransferase
MLVKNGFVDAAIPRITAEELKLRLDRGEKTILIDTRADWKFEMGHLPEATNIHYAIDSPFPGEEEAMDRELAALPDDALKVLYCN